MVALAKSRKNTMLERQTGNSWGSLDRPLGFKAGDTNLQRYVGNSPPNKVDPSGLADLSNGSNIVVENSTGLFGEWLESAVDAAAAALGLTEGFENKWAEKHEMQETFQTAGPDDIVIYLGERYKKGKEVGVMPANDIPGGDVKYFGLVKYLGTTYSLDEIITDLKKTPRDPAAILFAGCQSQVLGDRITKETNTKIVFGTTEDIGLGAARVITELFLKYLKEGKSAQEIVDAINRDRAGKDAKVIIFGDPKHTSVPLKDVLLPYSPPKPPPVVLPATIFGPYFDPKEGA